MEKGERTHRRGASDLGNGEEEEEGGREEEEEEGGRKEEEEGGREEEEGAKVFPFGQCSELENCR